MPAFSKTEIAHVAATDHRILRAPEAAGEGPPGPAPVGAPLVLFHADQLDPREVKSIDRELGIAMTTEGRLVGDPRLKARIGGLAQSLLDQSLAGRPDDPVARLARAGSLRLQGRLPEAMAAYEELLRSAPANEAALDEGASLALELGDRRAALRHARRSVASNPWSAGLHERLAKVLLLDQNLADAAREAGEALRLDPFLPLSRAVLIQVYLRRADLAQAREELTTLIALDPTERDVLQGWFDRQRQAAARSR
jgi:tetratricopeptide (TPR) repeat protein